MSYLWRSFFIALLATLGLIGALGFVVSRLSVSPPPERLMTPLFQMDLLDGWSCSMEGTEWVCSPAEDKKKTVAIIATKYRNDQDSLTAYLDHVREPRPLKWDDGSIRMSEVKHVGTRRIGAYEWAEGLHLSSELPNFYTHYLGTVTSHAGIVVTFSAHTSVFDRLNEDLERMVRSLLVYQRPLGSTGPVRGK